MRLIVWDWRLAIMPAAHSLGTGSCWLNQLPGLTHMPMIRELLTDLEIPDYTPNHADESGKRSSCIIHFFLYVRPHNLPVQGKFHQPSTRHKKSFFCQIASEDHLLLYR